MRFYLDEDLSQIIATIGRSLGLDVTSAQELGRRGIDDDAQLLFAAAEGRCVVTRNGRHFSALTIQFAELSRPHAGVLVVPSSLRGSEYAVIAQRLAAYAAEHPEEMLPNLLDYLRPIRR